jgi:amidase
MQRRHLLLLTPAALLPFPTHNMAATEYRPRTGRRLLEEVSANAMASGKLSAEQLTQQRLMRIDAVDRGGPRLNSIIELNPDAMAIARQRDAHGVQRLREAGAVILGKTNLSEWANIRSTSGSSSGTGAAIAASLAPLCVGTETDGSVVNPASISGLVGLQPNVGRVSRSGIISATATAAGGQALQALPADALRGARLGIARNHLSPFSEINRVFDQATAALRAAGAEVIDDIGLPPHTYRAAELSVLLHEFKAGLLLWFKAYAPHAPVQSLAEVIAYNMAHAKRASTACLPSTRSTPSSPPPVAWPG